MTYQKVLFDSRTLCSAFPLRTPPLGGVIIKMPILIIGIS